MPSASNKLKKPPTNTNEWRIYNKKPVNPTTIKASVEACGGLLAVVKHRDWSSVATHMKVEKSTAVGYV